MYGSHFTNEQCVQFTHLFNVYSETMIQDLIDECYEILYEMEDKRLEFHAKQEFKRRISYHGRLYKVQWHWMSKA